MNVLVSNKKEFQQLGRRKEATARLFLFLKEGSGKILINNKDSSEYFNTDPGLVLNFLRPLKLFNKEKNFDFFIRVSGGGFSAQTDAISLAISRFLLSKFQEFKVVLKQNKFLTRDPRAKERRKPGLLKARKKYPFVKR